MEKEECRTWHPGYNILDKWFSPDCFVVGGRRRRGFAFECGAKLVGVVLNLKEGHG
jgi:hypothetical protein